VALDARSGKLQWWYQLRANDDHDWDATVVSLFEAGGRKLVATSGKEGILHVLNREDGKLVSKLPMTTMLNHDVPLTPEGVRVCPVAGVQWNGAAHSPATGFLYVNAIDWCTVFKSGPNPTWVATIPYTGLANGWGTNDPIDKWSGWINAVDPRSGKMPWRIHTPTPMYAALTPTAGNVPFTGDLKVSGSAPLQGFKRIEDRWTSCRLPLSASRSNARSLLGLGVRTGVRTGVRSRVRSGVRSCMRSGSGTLGLGDPLDNGRWIVIRAHLRSLGLERYETVRARPARALAPLLLTAQTAAPPGTADCIQRSAKCQKQGQGYGDVHRRRVCLFAQARRKCPLSNCRWVAIDAAVSNAFRERATSNSGNASRRSRMLMCVC
jgi:hypothetical protein